jgi:nitrite reductase/ring-hydroxylating ferredoxin subunit
MTDVTVKDAGTALEFSADDIKANKNVYAEYTRADGKKIPLIAYLKPSGKLFVGISFCPPCEGEKQRIETDGTLTCESCGTKRTLETGIGISGSCKLYPLDELPVTLKDGKVTIEKSLIDNWTPQPLDRKVG